MKKILYLITINICFFTMLFLFYITSNLKILQLGIFLLYLLGVFLFFLEKNKCLAFIFFWGSILFLNLSKIFFDLFFLKEWNGTIWWIEHKYTIDAKIFTFSVIIFTLYSILLGKVFSLIKSKNVDINYKQNFYKVTKIILYIIFIYSSVIFFIKSYKELELIQKLGYASLYTGSLSKITYPFYFKGNILLFRSSFYIIIAHKIKEKKFIFLSFVYLGLFFLSALKGQRIHFLLEALFILFLYFRMYNKKINKKFYIYFFIFINIILFFIFYIGTKRGNSIASFDLVKFFYQYSSNLDIIPLYFDFKDKGLKEFMYFFSPLVDGINNILNYSIFKAGYSIEYIKFRTELQIQLSFFLNPSLYLQGYGLGGNYLVDIYSTFGFIGIFIVNFLLGYFLLNDNLFFKNKYTLIIYFFIFKKLLFSPRASLLFFPLELCFTLLLLYSCNFISKLSLNKGDKK